MNVNTGDKITVVWAGAQRTAIVTKITRNGNIYAKRWNVRRKVWTSPRRVYPYKGIYSATPLSESKK